MSEIDSYQHECIGIVHCPSDFEIVRGNDSHQNIPLYHLKVDALDGSSFQARKGDLLLGGGSGESAALWISMPEAVVLFTGKRRDEWHHEPVKAFWSMNEAFVFCSGYAKRGWTPNEPIEHWLARHVLAFVAREYPAIYGPWQGSANLGQGGSLCRLPTPEEKHLW